MAELIQRIRTQINTLFQSLDRRKKIWLAVGALFVVVIVVAILLLTRPKYVTLASNLEFDEMAKITALLKEQGITYKDEGTNNLYVDVKDLTRAKMAMAVDAGISQPDYGWTDVFANTSLTMTSELTEQQIMLAKANTLASSIESYIEGVEKVNVQLFIAEKSSFVLSDPTESSASVILKLKDNFQLSQEQVTGLVNYIMTAVENLPKENISIIDQNGTPLNKFSEQTETFMASSIREQTVLIEGQIDEKLSNFLGAVYGRNNVKVMTNVTLDFNEESVTSKAYAPPVEGETTGLVRSLSELTEKVSADAAEGAPGTDSNTDDTTYPTAGGAGNNIESASRTVNYELNEVVTVLNKAKGTISTIQISVLVNTDVLENNALSDEHKQELVELITTASGIETRKVTVTGMKFTDNEFGVTVFDSDSAQVSPGIPLWLVGIIVAVLAIGVILFFVLNRAKANKAREEEVARVKAEEEAKRQEELEEIQTDVEDKSSPKYQIEKFIDAKPEAVAALLRSWMTEM